MAERKINLIVGKGFEFVENEIPAPYPMVK